MSSIGQGACSNWRLERNDGLMFEELLVTITLQSNNPIYSWPLLATMTGALVRPDADPTASTAFTTSSPSVTLPKTKLWRSFEIRWP